MSADLKKWLDDMDDALAKLCASWKGAVQLPAAAFTDKEARAVLAATHAARTWMENIEKAVKARTEISGQCSVDSGQLSEEEGASDV